MHGQQRPTWGQLYLWSGLMFGALVAAQWLPISHREYTFLEICVFFVWGVVVSRWCRCNHVALEAVAEHEPPPTKDERAAFR